MDVPKKCAHCGKTEEGWRYNRCPDCGEMAEPKKPGLWSKLGNRLGEAIGTWFAGRQ